MTIPKSRGLVGRPIMAAGDFQSALPTFFAARRAALEGDCRLIARLTSTNGEEAA